MKKLQSILWMAAAGFLATACEIPTQYEYVRLSDAACTFLADGNIPKAIEVAASGPWSAETGASWLTVTEEAEGIVLAAADNKADSERRTEITIACGQATAHITVIQMAPEHRTNRYRILKTFDMGAVLSKNGRYAAGNVKTVRTDDVWENRPTVIDIETDEWIQFGPLPDDLYCIEVPFAVSDEGTVFFYDSNTNGCIGFDISGNAFTPKAPAGQTTIPQVQSISADGRIWVGWGHQPGNLYQPIRWIDGEPEILPVPPLNFRDAPYVTGVTVRGCSADGSVIYGSTWDNLDFGMLYWKDGKVDWVGSDVRETQSVQIDNGIGETIDYRLVNGMIATAEYTKISPNGRWIAGAYRTEKLAGNDIARTQYPAFFNTETGKTTIVTDFGEGYASHATDDGLGIILLGTFLPSSGIVYDIEHQVSLGSVEEWVSDNYGIVIPTGYITYITPDRSRLMGNVLESTAVGTRVVSWYVAPPLEK